MATGVLGIERAVRFLSATLRSYFNSECVLVQVDAGDGLTLDTISAGRDVVEAATAETWPFPGNVLIEVWGNGSLPAASGASSPMDPRLDLTHDMTVRVTLVARANEAMEIFRRRSDRAVTAVLRLFLLKYRESLATDGVAWIELQSTSHRTTEGDKLKREVTMGFSVVTQEFLT
jgi:hypothetical protein